VAEVPVGWMNDGARLRWAGGVVAGSLAWGMAMARLTDAALPLADAGIAGASVAAQWLQARRRVECWALWVLANIGAVIVYPQRGLYWTTALYALFLGLALWGWREWARAAGPRGQGLATA
jgi:nicotinamide mononucleotide transporter